MKVTIIPIVISALGTVIKELLKRLTVLEVGGRLKTILTTTLLKTAKILRRVLETCGDLRRLAVTQTNVDVKNYKGVKNDFIKE